MYEWKPTGKSRRERADVEQRLSVFYGSELREQPLPTSSWLRLRSRLGSQASSSRHWHMPHWRIHRRIRHRSTPVYVSTAFARIIREAHLPWSSSLLYCQFKAKVRIPSVHVSLLAKRNIRLTLPSNLANTVEPSELDVLLATGLARYFYVRKPAFVLLHLFVATVVLLACVALVHFWKSNMPYAAFPIVTGLCIVLLGFSYLKERKLGFRADDLMVQWLGRSTACRGLHALADRGHGRFRARLGEPSLAERISRICGTRIAIDDERLTLVR